MPTPRILFVDDDPGIRTTLPRVLELNDDNELLLRSARLRGETRYNRGCPLDLMIQNERLIEQVIRNVVYENLLSFNLSYLLLDMERMSDALLLQLQESIRSYMQAAERSGRRGAE